MPMLIGVLVLAHAGDGGFGKGFSRSNDGLQPIIPVVGLISANRSRDAMRTGARSPGKEAGQAPSSSGAAQQSQDVPFRQGYGVAARVPWL